MVDPRVGSGDLLSPLQTLGLNAELKPLEFGDVAFTGNGPQGEGCAWVGVERKRLKDMLGSIRSGRYSGHQLPGLRRRYDFCYLLVEGLYRPSRDQDGILEEHHGKDGWQPVVIGRSRFLYRELSMFLMTLQTVVGMPVLRSLSVPETAHLVRDLWQWWNRKTWAQHRAHVQFNLTTDQGLIDRPSLLRRMAKELPGIGWERSLAVEQEFRNVEQMVLADEKRWRGISGIGKVLAARAARAMRGEED